MIDLLKEETIKKIIEDGGIAIRPINVVKINNIYIPVIAVYTHSELNNIFVIVDEVENIHADDEDCIVVSFCFYCRIKPDYQQEYGILFRDFKTTLLELKKMLRRENFREATNDDIKNMSHSNFYNLVLKKEYNLW